MKRCPLFFCYYKMALIQLPLLISNQGGTVQKLPLPKQQLRDRKDVVLNSSVDLFLLVLVLILPAKDAWPYHVLRIIFFTRIADYSSLRPGRWWSIFNVDLPSCPSELNERRDLTLFTAYRILGKAWLIASIFLAFLTYHSSTAGG